MRAMEHTLPYPPIDWSASPLGSPMGHGTRDVVLTLVGPPVQEQKNPGIPPSAKRRSQGSVSSFSTVCADKGKVFTPSANTGHMAFDVGKVDRPQSTTSPPVTYGGSTQTASPPRSPSKIDRTIPVEVRAASPPRSALDALSAPAQDGFRLLEERIEVEVQERRRLWNSLMEDLGESQATVKKLEKKLEKMDKLEECLHKHCGVLQVQIGTLQRNIDHGGSSPQAYQTQKQLQMQMSRFAAQLQEAQQANESRNQELHAAISELQTQMLVNDNCNALEARLKAAIAQWKCSKESLSEQLSDLNGNCDSQSSALDVNDACSALEARLSDEIGQWKCSQEGLGEQLSQLDARSDTRCSTVGGGRVPGELVASMYEGLHRHIIKTLQAHVPSFERHPLQ